MKKLLAVLLFVVAGTFLCGNALALNTYIPHITTGSNDWSDYLQVNNNASSTATFTLTLYGSTGAQVYSQSHWVGGRSRYQIQLKALNSSAATGKITYTETGLIFRVSYESLGGGVAEFKTIDTLGSKIGFYFSDFSSLVQWKGVAIANMGSTNADVTFYALGGGSILGTSTVAIAPNTKAVGMHSYWFSSLNLSQVESIVAVTSASSLCGIAISGDVISSRLLFMPATPVSNFTAPTASGSLIGNYRFVYQIGSTIWTDNITLNTKTTTKTSEGSDFYTGYNSKYPSSTRAGGAWSPSLSMYLIVVDYLYIYGAAEGYTFSVNADNTLSGYHQLSVDDGNTWSSRHSLFIPESYRTLSGSSNISSLSKDDDPININLVLEKKIAEDREGQAQRTLLASPASDDSLILSKINEMRAIIKKHR